MTTRRQDLVWFERLAGVPAVPTPRYLHPEMLATLEAALKDLWACCPWGHAALIVHLGAFVDRPDPHGTDRHAQGRAIDIGSIEWPGQPPLVVRQVKRGDAWDMRRYLAVTAVLEKHLGCVLNLWQLDGRHHDHWHLDDHRTPGWTRGWVPSVRFAQAALEHVHAIPTRIDGIAGPRTLAGISAVVGPGLPMGGQEWWEAFLTATIAKGFSCIAPTRSDDSRSTGDAGHTSDGS